MPNIYLKSLLLFMVIFGMFSCEDVVELPYDLVSKLAVRSDLSDSTGLVAVVYIPKGATDTQPTQYVDSATVKVYQGKTFLEELALVLPNDSSPEQHPRYETQHLQPEFDVEYTLVVEVENFKTITSTTSIPTPVNLEDATFNPNFSLGPNDEVVVDFDISLSLRDPIAVKNYYHLKFYQELINYHIGAAGDTILENAFIISPADIYETAAQSPTVRYKAGQGFLFDDLQFNGQTLSLNFKGSYSFDPSKSLPGRFLIELRTVSEDYFLYHDTLNRTGQDNSHFGEGVVVYNNIDNGLGNFAGFTSTVNSFKLSN